MTYGEAAGVEEMSAGRYLPEGSRPRAASFAVTSRRTRCITYDDVDLPPGRLADRLRAEQYERFRGETWLSEVTVVGASA